MTPLRHVRVLEIAGLGPAPFAAMMLADAGAEVVRVARPGDPGYSAGILERGRPTVEANLKDPHDLARVRRLVDGADVLLEGFRPGVMERLGLGPQECLARNPRLVYGRMTGWGQDGPHARSAGHDINYLAATGALHSLSREGEPPMPPLNLVGDFGGGGMLLAYGVLVALLERSASGEGQVVDAAMVDGTHLLMVGVWSRVQAGGWGRPGTNEIDTGAPYYNVYATSDGRYMAIGAVEPVFYATALEVLGLDRTDLLARQHDRGHWNQAKATIAAAFAARTFGDWTQAFACVDACVTPVLDLDEAAGSAMAAERNMFVRVNGATGPAPAPRYSRSRHAAHDVETTTDLDHAVERWSVPSST
jgi:alpha-methylacyl-CoA racemase